MGVVQISVIVLFVLVVSLLVLAAYCVAESEYKKYEYGRRYPRHDIRHGKYVKVWRDGPTPKRCIKCGESRLSGMNIWKRTFPPLPEGQYLEDKDFGLICWDCIVDKWLEAQEIGGESE